MARRLLTALLLLATLLAALPAPAPVAAASCVVTVALDNLAVPPAGSLRQKLADSSCSAITFSLPGSGPWTISLAGTLPTITRPLTITGPGQANLTIQPAASIATANRFLLLFIDGRTVSGGTPNMAVAISGLTLSGGRATVQLEGSNGGNLRSWQANVTLTDVTLKDATGTYYSAGAGATFSGGTSTLTRVLVSGNSAIGSVEYATGAGLYIDDFYGDTSVSITDSTIVGNTALSYNGGGLAIVHDSGAVENSLGVVLTNTIVGTPANPNRALSSITGPIVSGGGGIYNRGGYLSLTNSTVSGNTAANQGGGLYVQDTSTRLSTARVIDSVVNANSAGVGGGLFVSGQARDFPLTFTLFRSTVSGNTATTDGGGMYLSNVFGDGFLGTLPNTLLTGSTISDNTASHGNGGGVFLENDASEFGTLVELPTNIVSGNTAGTSGGGLYISNQGTHSLLARLYTSTVSGNAAGSQGGGLYIQNSGTSDGSATVSLGSSTVSGNAAGTDGGGLYARNAATSGGSVAVTLGSDTVTGNSADRDDNVTGSGGGLVLAPGSGSTLSVRNSIVAGNRRGTASPVISDCVGSLTSQGFNLWGEHGACPHGADVGSGDQDLATINRTITQVLNPTLANNGGFGKTHALVPGSPALDVFDGASCAGTDQRGISRPQGTRCDVGAYEARTSTLTTGTAGGGTGTVSPTTGPQIEGVVSVSATPTGGSTFGGWTVDGSAAGSANPLSVTMDAAHTVVATFSAPAPSPSPSPSPSVAPSPSPSPSPSPIPLVVPPPPADQGTVTVQQRGDQATLTATPAEGELFLGWQLSGAGGASISAQAAPTLTSWANPWTLTLTQASTIIPVFVPTPTFTDVSTTDPAATAIAQLAARGVINGCFTDPATGAKDFCPTESTLRHQMAALIARAMPGWVDETGLPTFGDNTDDTELMTRVATLQRHNVVRGYQADVCAERNIATPPGCYGPLDTVKYGQVMLFIARAMVEKGYWTLQADDRTIFPDQNGAVGADPDIDQQTKDHRAVVTYVHYVTSVPDVANVHANFVLANGQGWGDAAPRAWFARAFWPALVSYFGADNVP